jgi:hypothetical protein
MLPRRIRTDGFVEPCIPSRAPKPPSGPDWVHEIKHDGYRLIVRRDGETVRLFTRRGTRQGPPLAREAISGLRPPHGERLDGEPPQQDGAERRRRRKPQAHIAIDEALKGETLYPQAEREQHVPVCLDVRRTLDQVTVRPFALLSPGV